MAKGFLSKLFGAKFEKAAAELEAKTQKRMAPRIQLQPLHRIRFVPTKPMTGMLADSRGGGLALGIANVSLSGIGFTRESVAEWPASGSLIEGELEAGDRKASVTVKLVHVTGRLAGCSFQGEFGVVQRLVLDYFRVELAALNMIQAPADILKEEPDGAPHWFHGKNNCELFYVTKPDAPSALVRFQLSFFANYIESGEDGTPRFGTVVEDEGGDKPMHKGSTLVCWQDAPEPELIETFVKFLKNISGLPAEIRDELARQIRWVREKKK